MDGFAANSHGSDLSADQEPFRAPTSSVRPHPRHAPRSLHTDAWYQTGYQQQHDYQFHLVDDDDKPAAHHDDRSPATIDDDRSASSTGDDTASSPSDRLSPGDRFLDPRVLGQVRASGCGVGDRDWVAGIELPTGRREPHWLLLDLPDGAALAQGHVRGSRVSRLVRSTVRRTGLSRGRCVALCVLGTVTLAALIGKVV